MIQSEKLAALSRLSAGVSHEIGNPLTSISSYVQILMDMEFDDFTTESLETISKHVRRIEAILEKMSAFSSSKDDGMAPHDIAEVVRSTVEIVRYDRRTKNIDIQVDMPEEIPDVVVNASQMVQVISNLILNAADAMPDGGKLVIRATSDEGFVNISFKDNGVGIETENLKKVFDPFFTTKQAGTGLGLAVCHSIINLFGGDINVESVKGEGSTFTIKLPAYKNE
jgi:signal transduction histidine kinase